MLPPQPLGRSIMLRLSGSGLQNLDSTSSKSSSRSSAILNRYVFTSPVSKGNARTRRARPEPLLLLRRRALSRGVHEGSVLMRSRKRTLRVRERWRRRTSRGAEDQRCPFLHQVATLSFPSRFGTFQSHLPLLGPGCNYNHTTSYFPQPLLFWLH